jgi:hypothetical protein
MKEINFKKTVHGSTKEVVAKLTEALKAEGFGVLPRIIVKCFPDIKNQ